MKPRFGLMLTLLMMSMAGSLFASEPVPTTLKTLPKIYEDKGACPFECCTYRQWTSQADVTLFDAPHSSKVVGIVKKGEVVRGVTGIVYVTPTPLEVTFPHGPYKKGDQIYLLTNLGEGFAKVWFQGKVTEEEMIETEAMSGQCEGTGCSNGCGAHPSKTCWAKLNDKIQPSEWWVQIKTKSGLTGWTPKSEQFSGEDSCG